MNSSPPPLVPSRGSPRRSSARGLLITALLLLPALAVAEGGVGDVLAREREHAQLRQRITELLARSPLRAARMALHIESVPSGEVIFSKNSDELLNPASNVKLVTAAVALVKLGLDHRFETEFLVDGELKGGKTKALYVRGRGDPSLTTERLFAIAAELKHAGLREVGDLFLDETYFDADREPPGYDQETSDRAYMAPTGAISLNWNAVAVYLRPGDTPGSKASVEVEPGSDYFVIDAQLTTGNKRRRRFSVSSKPDKDGVRQRIAARGTIPTGAGGWSVCKKIDHPALYFGHTLKALLTQQGVRVKGKLRLAPAAPNARLLHVATSETFDIILKRMNKHSSNFVAEQLLKTLGAEVKGTPGSTAKGIEVVEEFLEQEVKLPRGSYVMRNGSGLNDTNRFSAAQLVKLLRHMEAIHPIEPEFLSALGIAGKDGTLKYRFEGSEAVGRLRAKTGTLENVSALSGYVASLGGERFAFSVIVNDAPGRIGRIVPHIDALAGLIAAAGTAPVLPAAPPVTEAPSSASQVLSRMKMYLNMGRSADRRNLPFLKTAWRTEKDPALRAVLADSLYLSDPQDYLGVRALLDSFVATDEVFGRIVTFAPQLGGETPCVGSVVELAASGNAEAMSRLVELASAPRRAPADQELADGLADVARTAADELLMGLYGAEPKPGEAALGLLGQGLSRSGDDKHPFWPALRRAMGATDARFAAFARKLEAALSLSIANAKAPAEASRAPAPKQSGAGGASRPGG